MKYSDESAFPTPAQAGMTKLDYFTAMAMQSIMAGVNYREHNTPDKIAEGAIIIAKAVLTKLEKA